VLDHANRTLLRLGTLMRRAGLVMRWCWALVMMLAAGSFGCGGVYYTVQVNAAQSRIEQARELGAETQAPYEYYYAKEHLHQAQVEAATASYGDAATYAEVAETYAQKAIDLITAARRKDSESK